MYVFQKAEIALAEVTRAISAFANLFQIELETVIYVSTWVCFEPFRRDSTRSKDGLQFKYNLFRRFVSLLAEALFLVFADGRNSEHQEKSLC